MILLGEKCGKGAMGRRNSLSKVGNTARAELPRRARHWGGGRGYKQ